MAHCCTLARSTSQLSLRRRLVGCLLECHQESEQQTSKTSWHSLQLVTLLKMLPLGLSLSAELPKGVMEPLGEFSDLLLVTGGPPHLPQLLSGLVPFQPQFCSTTSMALDYQAYLSQKTREKKEGGPKKKPCALCGKFFQRLDTHLRTSATCRAVPQGSPPASPIASVHQSLLPQNFPTPLTSEPLPHHSIPSATLDPFLYPKSQEEWQAADGCLAATVVPAVLAASTVDEKHHTLCSGAYRYFSAEYGTHSSKPSRKRKHKEAFSLWTVSEVAPQNFEVFSTERTGVSLTWIHHSC